MRTSHFSFGDTAPWRPDTQLVRICGLIIVCDPLLFCRRVGFVSDHLRATEASVPAFLTEPAAGWTNWQGGRALTTGAKPSTILWASVHALPLKCLQPLISQGATSDRPIGPRVVQGLAAGDCRGLIRLAKWPGIGPAGPVPSCGAGRCRSPAKGAYTS